MTQFDGQAIAEIVALTRKTQPIITTGEEQKGVYFLLQPDGSYQKMQAEMDPVNLTALSIESFTRLMNGSDREWKIIHVSPSKAVGLAENEHHRQTITLNFPKHPLFLLLTKWLTLAKLPQKDFVRLLRTQFLGYVEPSLIRTLESVKVKTEKNAQSNVQNGNRAIERSLVQQVQQQNGTSIPEMFVVEIPVYDLTETRTIKYPITVLIEMEADEDGNVFFHLIAVHTELRDAEEKALQYIIGEIDNKINSDINIYESSL